MNQRARHQAWRAAAVVLAAVWVGTWLARPQDTARAQSQQGSGVTRVQVVQDSDALLGAGDVRFGVAVVPGGGAVVANWKNFRAFHVDARGRTIDLGIRLRHQHTAIAIPPDGLVILEDLQGDYYAVTADGRIAPVPGIN